MSEHLNQFRLMAQYNAWANHNLYDLVATLSEDDRQRNLGTFFGSIHGTLNHILLADRAWLGRFATGTPHRFNAFENAKLIYQFESLSQILYTDFLELRQERAETDCLIETWLQELEPEKLSAHTHYSNAASGVERKHSLWFGIAHFFNHQTHHRSQVTTLLHQLGHSYGITDFIAMYDLAPDLARQ